MLAATASEAPTHNDAIKVSVLGTGLIGLPIARNLAGKGFVVRAWNRTRGKAEALRQNGVDVFDTPAEAVHGAGVIVTALYDGAAVQEAMEAALPGITKGAVWLQLSTVGVDATEELASLATRAGLVLYDAPVLGTRQPAEQGKLVILGSGPEAQRSIAQPVFDAIGAKTIWVADRPGPSSRLKLALNAWVLALTHGVAESLSIAKGLGIDPALVLEAITGGPLDSGYFQSKGKAMLAGDYAASFSVKNGAKDGQLLLDAMAGTDVRIDIVAAGLERFRRAIEAGHGDKDIAASFLA